MNGREEEKKAIGRDSIVPTRMYHADAPSPELTNRLRGLFSIRTRCHSGLEERQQWKKGRKEACFRQRLFIAFASPTFPFLPFSAFGLRAAPPCATSFTHHCALHFDSSCSERRALNRLHRAGERRSGKGERAREHAGHRQVNHPRAKERREEEIHTRIHTHIHTHTHKAPTQKRSIKSSRKTELANESLARSNGAMAAAADVAAAPLAGDSAGRVCQRDAV